MPKSKRNIQVTLSKVKSKGRAQKEALIEAIRESLDKFSSVYVFSYGNLRNKKLKEIRDSFKANSRFFLGCNRVMQVALGRTASDEIKPGLCKISQFLRGNTGLFLTNMAKEEVEKVFDKLEFYDFAKTGSRATEKVELKEGPLTEFTHDMEPFLRKQGMPVRLNKGVVELISDFVVCEEGNPLSPEAARILRLLGMKQALFKLHLVCRLSGDDFELYREAPEDSDIES